MDKQQRLITDYFTKIEKVIYGYNEKTKSWHCIECGTDMGPMNPRQLCAKTHCLLYFE
jgi:hypothetical protein